MERSGRALALYWQVRRHFTGRVSRIRAVHAGGRSAIVINTERIITAAPAPPDGQGTRVTFTNDSHQDVKELIADVVRRLNITA